jgi:uncharacterized protein YjbI with pentapeptide repeats
VLRDCRVEELDLSGATLTDVAMPGVVLGAGTLAGARLRRVDLTATDVTAVLDVGSLAGAAITEVQAITLARRLAEAAGITVARPDR